VGRLSALVGLPFREPADDEARARQSSRLEALGALAGLVTGAAIGAAIGAADGAVDGRLARLPGAVGSTLVGGAALVGANGPMIALGITDPRAWTAADWVSDVVPHLAYGLVTRTTYAALVD
jgi:hypothetical protein